MKVIICILIIASILATTSIAYIISRISYIQKHYRYNKRVRNSFIGGFILVQWVVTMLLFAVLFAVVEIAFRAPGPATCPSGSYGCFFHGSAEDGMFLTFEEINRVKEEVDTNYQRIVIEVTLHLLLPPFVPNHCYTSSNEIVCYWANRVNSQATDSFLDWWQFLLLQGLGVLSGLATGGLLHKSL